MPAGTEYREYGPTLDDATPHWYQIPISDDDGDRIIAIIVTDRGIGDDEDFTVNGAIVDDGGLSLPLTKKGDPDGDGSVTSSVCPHDPAASRRNDRFTGHFTSAQPPVNTYRI